MGKKKRRNKSDWGDDFVAPDGGWGWVVCVAGGLSNLSILPVWGSFGLIFRDRLLQNGLTNSQITTIINTQPAMLSCTGIFNGPLFRKFTYRQTAMFGTILITIGLLILSVANSFFGYFMGYSIFFGIGMGLSLSSTFLTLNTYFKEKRRRANSFLLTISGTGPIFWPHVANALLLSFGVKGTAIIFSAISMHAFACALIYQPVKWHTTKTIKSIDSNNQICSICQLKITANTEKFNNVNETSTLMTNNKKDIYLSIEKPSEIQKINQNGINMEIINDICKCNEKSINSIKINQISKIDDEDNEIVDDKTKIKFKFFDKIIKFFDLDLLKDFTYLNLVIGLTLSTFSEQNFTILIPFFLSDFNFTKFQIATSMSVMGFGELSVRFLIPFITDCINWDNRIFFMIGISGMTIGRIFIAQIPRFELLLIIFGFMGICRAFRTVFMGLVIPDYVQLKRLPAATGLQLLSAGLFTLSCGPIVGLIKDATNSSFILYFLSMISATNVILWTVEMLYRSYKMKILCKKELENKIV